MLVNTLIIDKRKELSTKYKKLIEDKTNCVSIVHSLNSAMRFIQEREPDLIIVSDTIDEDLADFCKKIRILTYNMRPVIVAISKSAELSDKLRVLDNGADDFISEPISSEEFKMRIKAHLRREFESNIDIKLGLPNKIYSLRALKRLISENTPWATLLVSIENFENYKETYTELASDKLLQTFCAITNSALSDGDFFGLISENKFLIITTSLKAEKIASFLVFALNSVCEKFYSPQDVARGYTIMQGDEYAGRRSEFIYTTIGVVTNEFTKYKNEKELLNSLIHTHSLAQTPSKSNYIIERPKISAENSVIENIYNKTVAIIERDEALSLLLTTAIKLQGFEGEAFSDIPQKIPAVIILDAGTLENKFGLALCKKIKSDEKFLKTKVIMTSILHDKEMILNTGADLYLPKPYDLANLGKWVRKFIAEFNI